MVLRLVLDRSSGVRWRGTFQAILEGRLSQKGGSIMSLYWQSLNPMHQFRGEVDRLLVRFLSNLTDGNGIGAVRGQPAVNMWDTADSVLSSPRYRD